MAESSELERCTEALRALDPARQDAAANDHIAELKRRAIREGRPDVVAVLDHPQLGKLFKGMFVAGWIDAVEFLTR